MSWNTHLSRSDPLTQRSKLLHNRREGSTLDADHPANWSAPLGLDSLS